METAKHTPTPWTAVGKVIYGATPEDGVIGGAHDVTDAEFIAKACNMHKELVELLEEANRGCTQLQFRDWEKRATLALAKAKGGE